MVSCPDSRTLHGTAGGDVRVAHFFAREIAELRDAFRDWHPKTSILRDLKRKLQPIQCLPTSFTSIAPSSSKMLFLFGFPSHYHALSRTYTNL
jgi:hypothetical protein